MILQALVDHYEALAKEGKISRRGWCRAKVSYAIHLSKEGTVKGIISLKTEEQRGKKTVEVPAFLTVPEMVTRTVGVASNYLCDNSKYLLGIGREADGEREKKRILECFQAAKERHLSLLKEVDGEMAQAIRRYFETWNPQEARECQKIKENWEEITDGGNLIFCMGMNYAQDDESIKEAWEEQQNGEGGESEGICLVTGQKTEIARIHRTIKGVPGAQSSGAALVSFNAPAFESYGKEQSYNAPVGKYAEFAYTTALNYLLSQKEYAIPIGDSMIVFWAESGREEYQKLFFMSVDPAQDNQETVRGVFTNLKKQEPICINELELDPDQIFYILGLAPNAARLSVRFFYQNSFGAILDHISEHYERMKIVKPIWEEQEYLGVRKMLFETVNQNSKDKKPVSNMAAMVLQAILSGGRYPAGLYSDTLIRIRAEQGRMTWGRAAILKAYLIKNENWKEGEDFVGLNENSNEIAYVLGRLFAVLESIQIDANPGIKATIRDRYFNSACATPASVFPVLIRLKNSHIKKIEREKESSRVYYEQLLTGILGKLEEREGFPKRLSLEEQGKFILGYYHQMQKKYAKREDK